MVGLLVPARIHTSFLELEVSLVFRNGILLARPINFQEEEERTYCKLRHQMTHFFPAQLCLRGPSPLRVVFKLKTEEVFRRNVLLRPADFR